jgi:hypothetical protein
MEPGVSLVAADARASSHRGYANNTAPIVLRRTDADEIAPVALAAD